MKDLSNEEDYKKVLCFTVYLVWLDVNLLFQSFV